MLNATATTSNKGLRALGSPSLSGRPEGAGVADGSRAALSARQDPLNVMQLQGLGEGNYVDLVFPVHNVSTVTDRLRQVIATGVS